MIAANSRYANSTVVPATDLDGNDIMAIIFNVPTDYNISFTYYQVKGNDEITALAAKYYGNPTYWWVIANANPEILDWSALATGYLLRIPSGNTL